MGMKSEIEQALEVHALWRKRFKDYLNGRESFEIATVGASDQCQFGKWLNREGNRLMPASLYGEICAAHDEFHRIAASIVHKIKSKQFAEAHQDIEAEGPFNRASEHLASILLRASLREPNSSTVKKEADAPEAAAPAAQPAAPPDGT